MKIFQPVRKQVLTDGKLACIQCRLVSAWQMYYFHRDRDFAPILNVEALVWSALAGFGGRNAKFPYKAHAILI